MQTFLDNILKDLETQGEDIAKVTFVLPSKRAGVFLKNAIKITSQKTQILPRIVSLEEFIDQLSELVLIEQTTLLFELYKVYLISPITKHDSFDEFSKWANMLLQDFNEINRHLIDDKHLFAYLSDIKRIERLLQQENTTDLIDNQLQFYDEMPFLFDQLNSNLLEQKIAYQGLQYRVAVDKIDDFIDSNSQKFVFAGFNALNKAEEIILEKLHLADQALFYWDLDKFFLNEKHNASLFIKRYLKKFSNDNQPKWLSNDFLKTKNIEIIGVPKKIGQVKKVSEILDKQIREGRDNQNMALVLADETLLNPMLTALPSTVLEANITMGLAINNLPLATCVEVIFKMHIQAKQDRFNYNHIIEVLRYSKQLNLLPAEIVESLIEKIKINNYFFISKEELVKIENNLVKIDFLFDSLEDNCQLALKKVLKFIAMIPSKGKRDVLFEEAKNKMITIFQQLQNLNQKYGYLNSLKTLYHYYQQLLVNEKLSFKGEPLSGLQIMGTLETRALDFETIIITSVNEQVLPAGKSNNSFIPFDIKNELKLPTYLEKNAIFSYHFFRLLQRAKKIFLIYNLETDDFGSGEQSRFLTQLERYKTTDIHKIIASPKVISSPIGLKLINKNEHIEVRLHELAKLGFSATTLTSYIRNPLEFYKQRILKIKNIDHVEEIVAANTLGTIIHKSLEELYTPFLNSTLSISRLTEIHDKSENVIKKYFSIEYRHGNIDTGKNLLILHVAKQFVQNFISSEISQLKDGNTITLKAVEEKIECSIKLKGFDFPIKLKGEIDRIDVFNDTIRIIDYKTGLVEPRDLNIRDWSDLICTDKKSKAFQVLFYALMYKTREKINLNERGLESGVISLKRIKHGFQRVNNNMINDEDLNSFTTQLNELFLEIYNSEIPFVEKEVKNFK